MTNLTTQQIREIVNGAPEGANLVANTGYKSMNSRNTWFPPEGIDVSCLTYGWHQLSDLRRILELEAAILNYLESEESCEDEEDRATAFDKLNAVLPTPPEQVK